MTYERYYKMFGVRRPADLLNPVVLNLAQLTLPTDSAVFHYTNDKLPVFPDENLEMFPAKKTILYFVTEYVASTGGFTKINKASSLLRSQKTQLKKFKIVETKAGTLLKPASTLLVFSYGLLGPNHLFRKTRDSELVRFKNGLNTLIANICTETGITNRHRHVILSLPSVIPAIQDFRKFEGKEGLVLLNTFTSQESLVLLDLWNFLHPKHREKSFFSKLSSNDLKNIDFLFTNGKNATVLNLGILEAMVEEYESEIKTSSYSASKIRTALILMFIKTQRTTGLPMALATKKRLNVSSELLTLNIDEDFDVERAFNEVQEENETIVTEEEPELEENETPDVEVHNTSVEEFKATLSKPPTEEMRDAVEKAFKNGEISGPKRTKMLNILKEQEKLFGPGLIKLELTKEELTVTDAEIKVNDSDSVFDKSMLTDSLSAIEKKYLAVGLDKNTLAAIYKMQSVGVLIEDIERVKEANITGGVEIFKVKVLPIDGNATTLTMRVPIINEDGTFKTGNNTYRMLKQRVDVPIRKIKPTEVALTSNQKKLFIKKVKKTKNDIGSFLLKTLRTAELSKESGISLVLEGSDIVYYVTLPLLYTQLNRFVRGFKFKGTMFNFVFKERLEGVPVNLLGKIELIEREGTVLIGHDKSYLYFLNMNGEIFKDSASPVKTKGTARVKTNFYDYFGLSNEKEPVEFATMTIFNRNVPIALLLSYYIGFEKLVNLLDPTNIFVPAGTRFKLESNQYSIKFANTTFILDKTNIKASMILGGFSEIQKDIKLIDHEALNRKESYTILFNLLELDNKFVTELLFLDKLFVDPVTESILKDMNEPTTFVGLLFRASELLEDYYAKHPNEMDEIIRGYDRVPSVIYRNLSKAMKEYENSKQFTTPKVKQISPYDTWTEITGDQTTTIVDDLNPYAYIKQIEDVTFRGAGGRSVETMVKETRQVHPSQIGIISEASKDSGDVGITNGMSASPTITSILGKVEQKPVEEIGFSRVLSTTGVMVPGAIKDHPKRANFISTQAGSFQASTNLRVALVTTGYDRVFSQRLPDRFVATAEEEGVVISKSKTKLKVKGVSGKLRTVKLGEWTTKEAAGHTDLHDIVTNLKKGDEYKKGATLAFDKVFFAPDPFEKEFVVMKTMSLARIVLTDEEVTHEDSCAVGKSFSEQCKVETVEVESIIANFKDLVLDNLKVGSKSSSTEPLIILGDELGGETKGLSKASLKTLKGLKQRRPKGTTGKVMKIICYYNGNIEDMSASMRSFVQTSDKFLLETEGYTGRVDDTYSVKGKGLEANTLEIKYFIKDMEALSTGDKIVFGSQLKTTVGEVLPHPVVDESGNEIDALFGSTPEAARIVESFKEVSIATTLLNHLAEISYNMYFKGK